MKYIYIGEFYTDQVEKTVNALVDSDVDPSTIVTQDSSWDTVMIWVRENGSKSVETRFTRLDTRNQCF